MRDHSGPGHGRHGARCCNSCAWQVLRATACQTKLLLVYFPLHCPPMQHFSCDGHRTLHRLKAARYMALLDCLAVIKSFFFLRSFSPSPPRLVRFLALVALSLLSRPPFGHPMGTLCFFVAARPGRTNFLALHHSTRTQQLVGPRTTCDQSHADQEMVGSWRSSLAHTTFRP